MSDLVANFATLFEGRKDAYGTEEGGCQRVEPIRFSLSNLGLWALHLDGHEPIGIYPMVPAGIEDSETRMSDFGHVVKWGCVDFDLITDHKPGGDFRTEGSCHEASLNLVAALDAFGLTGWIERTRSRGRHVWVFARGWVFAHTMRRALLVASEVAGTPTREVNPKQESLPDGALGNYVRLPYPGDTAVGDRSVYLPHCNTPDQPYMDCEHFVQAAMATRSRTEDLEAAAKLWLPPPPPIVVHAVEDVEFDATLRRRMGALARKIVTEGPLPHADRSTTLMRLAHLCREDGLTPEQAYAAVSTADLRWGKFHNRADGEQRMLQIVERAYAGWEEG